MSLKGRKLPGNGQMDRIFKILKIKLTPGVHLSLPVYDNNSQTSLLVARWDRDAPPSKRKCRLCENNDVGDEYHYLLTCSFFADLRRQYIQKYYFTRPNILKYKELLSLTSPRKLVKLSSFIRILIHVAEFSSPAVIGCSQNFIWSVNGNAY